VFVHSESRSAGKPHSVPVSGFNQTGISFSVGLGFITPVGVNSNYSGEW